MKKLYVAIISIAIISILFYVAFVDATEKTHTDKRFEYGRIRLNDNNYHIRWETGNRTFISNISASGSDETKYASQCQNLLLQMGADFDQIGQVRNVVSVFDFLGNDGWELFSSIKDSYTTIYIFKREY